MSLVIVNNGCHQTVTTTHAIHCTVISACTDLVGTNYYQATIRQTSGVPTITLSCVSTSRYSLVEVRERSSWSDALSGSQKWARSVQPENMVPQTSSQCHIVYCVQHSSFSTAHGYLNLRKGGGGGLIAPRLFCDKREGDRGGGQERKPFIQWLFLVKDKTISLGGVSQP